MNLIVAVDKNWTIGCKGKLLVSIPGDMKFFREHTMGKVVVMGRKTLESFPNGLPLKNRTNIVLTSDKGYSIKDTTVVHDLDTLFEVLKKYNREDIYTIGGETIYRQLLSYCKTAYITKIDYSYEGDTYFPNLDTDPSWRMVEESEEQTYFDLEYYFTKYENKNVIEF